MCGIVAIFTDRPDSATAHLLLSMRERLAHRGPDARSHWIGRHGSSTVALAHRRLSILDPKPRSDQPFFIRSARVGVIFNGEIFNYIELRAELQKRGVAFETQSDTEVLLQSYLAWGEHCVDHFNGQFAFVIWDARRALGFAARDRFGEKPFFYAVLPSGGLAIASEMKALLAHPEVGTDVAEDVLREFAVGTPDYSGAQTPFRAIRRLQPAHALAIAPTGAVVRQWRYWTPRYDDPTRPFDPATDVEEFRELLRDAVRIRMRSDVTVGASLSGGLDSSSLVALMANDGMVASGQVRHAISARFDADPSLSEGAYVDSVVARTGIPALPVTPDPLRLAAESQALHYHLETPYPSASAYLEWCVRRAARESGLVVMIDGQGADELLGGYQTYFCLRQSDLADTLHWVQLTQDSLAFRRRLDVAARAYDEPERRIQQSVVRPVLPLIAKALVKAALRAIRPSFRQARLPRRPGLPDPASGNLFRHMLASGLLYSSLPDQLVTADLNSMAFGVETRFPFLDYRLVDRTVGLPTEALIHDGWTKWILRAAMNGLLPEDVRWRVDKLGFAAPLDKWLRGPLREWAHERLFAGPAAALPYYPARQLRDDWARHQACQADLSWKLWRWISTSEWLSLSSSGVWKRGLSPQIADTAEEHAASASWQAN